ncbi:MAG: hypothetical protein AAF830_17650, partial [Pseudomonadota bacterium]
MDDSAMQCEQQLLERGGLRIKAGFSPKQAKAIAPRGQPDDLLLISGHGEYYNFSSILVKNKEKDELKIEVEAIVQSLASARLTKQLESILLLACYSGGRFFHRTWKTSQSGQISRQSNVV